MCIRDSYTAVDQSTVTIGTVFAACGFQEFSLYRANLIQMFLLAAVASFMISFCIVWLFSYNLVRPLRQMACLLYTSTGLAGSGVGSRRSHDG